MWLLENECDYSIFCLFRKVESTDCAPNNGYYFLPVSPDDRGSFVLKATPPRGWKVEPSEFELEIDGESDQCSKGQDMNFEFIGFGITGSVLSKGAETGPKDLQIELLRDGNVINSALTDSDGRYDFFGVTPGDYVVQVSKESVKSLALDATSRKIHVGEDVRVVDSFNILGYSIEGKIIGINQEPQKGLKFELYQGQTKVSEATSDQTGHFVFSKIPVGAYIVKLSDSLSKSIDLAKSQQNVELVHENLKLEEFQVTSFSVSGEIMAGNRPLKNVKIQADKSGEKEEFLAADGKFVLKGVSKPPLKIKAVLEGFDFDTLTLDQLEAGMKLPALKPTRFRLSGKVDRGGSDEEITVKFNNEKEETIGKVIVTDTGLFSIYLPAGEYKVSVAISKQAKIGFAPLEHKVKVTDAPVGNLNFHAIKADIEGKVICLGSTCESPTHVTLSLDRRVVSKAEVKKDGAFKFTGVLPATYTLSVTEDGICWDEAVKKISVSKDIKDVTFKQIGHYLTTLSTRPTLMVIEGAKSKERQEVNLAAGNNVICVKILDDQINFQTKGCEEFEIKPQSLSLKAKMDEIIHLKSVKYSVSGRILSGSKPAQDLSATELKIVAKSDQRQVELDLKKIDNGFSFNLMALPGEEVVFQPVSQKYLFDPESLHVFVDQDCHLDVATFVAHKGHFVQGQVSPPVEGVKIKILNAEPNQKFVETLTDKSGKYSLGPLPQAVYKVEASKEGFVFEETATGFSSKKLASIQVKVKDNEGNDLNGVVISVSGGDFRSNTKSESGQVEFLSLAPGEYFIKPQLKEYEFKPKHQMHKLGEGQNAQISWTAKRVAFSIFGKLNSLNGQTEPGVTLRATSKDCGDISEEAMSESDGTFRFRGLKPKCEYTIALHHGENIERIYPTEVKVKMDESDHKLTKPIVAIRAFETMDILLKVKEELKNKNQEKSSLKISLSAKDFSYNTKAVTGQLVTLPRVPKDGKKYHLYVETVPSKFGSQKKINYDFVADEYVKSIKLTLDKSDTATKQNRKMSTWDYFLPLIAAIVMGYLMWDQRVRFFKNLMENGLQVSGPSQNTRRASNNDEMSVDGWEVVSTPSGGASKRRNNKKR